MAIQWDKFTTKAQQAIEAARNTATEHGNAEILPMHLLHALLDDREGIVRPVLEKAGADPDAVAARLNQAITALPKVSGGAAQVGLSNALTKVLDRSFKEAKDFKDEYV